MQQDIWTAYNNSHPGQVQVIGVDLYNGTAAQERSFGNATGATYPLLLRGADGAAGVGNLNTLYMPTSGVTYDNYVVINKHGIVRYHAANRYAHGNRYHLNEIRGTVDSLVTNPTDVGDGPGPLGWSLRVTPSPFHATTSIEFVNDGPATTARLRVFNLAGREIAARSASAVPRGPGHLSWDGRDTAGNRVASGVYLVRVEVGRVRLTSRVVYLE